MAQARPLSLHPLKFEEVITDLLKIKPTPKPPRKRRVKTVSKAKPRKDSR